LFEKVLVPTDFSKYARKVLDCIGEIPGIKEAIILHIIDASNPSLAEKHGWNYDTLINNAKSQLEEQKKYVESLGIKAKIDLDVITDDSGGLSGPDFVDLRRFKPRDDIKLVKGGNIASAIQKAADREGASLIVMGARGKSLVRDIFMGSISTDVLRHGKTNLLIIRHRSLEGGTNFEKFCSNIFSRVLCPTDFSKPSEESISLIKSLKGVNEVILAHVITFGETPWEIEMETVYATKKLESISSDLIKAGFKTTIHIREGSPAEKIISVAKEQDASLIVISSHGKGWLEQLMVGSTAFDVAKRAEQPVLVARFLKA
jgi:nucleotide-binding universal stress UspA family protein